MDVEAFAFDDDHAKSKARRYGSLQHMKGLPTVMITDVHYDDEGGARCVGTWEYWLKGPRKGRHYWHDGQWTDRPDTSTPAALRAFGLQSI